jgi:hypothetical protein
MTRWSLESDSSADLRGSLPRGYLDIHPPLAFLFELVSRYIALRVAGWGGGGAGGDAAPRSRTESEPEKQPRTCFYLELN